MKSFAEQLSEYVQRVGVSDAELARRLGVSRQTVFRWREGLTQRPRRREDVAEIASRLRLSPAERDELLLAAGFPPEAVPGAQPGSEAAPVSQGSEAEPGSHPAVGAPVGSRVEPAARPALGPQWFVAAVLAAVLLAAVAFPEVRGELASRIGLGDVPGPAEWDGTGTLVLVSQFANYSGAQVGYNIAGRLREALDQELRAAGLENVQVAVAEQIAVDQHAAREMGARWGASLVVWGEYDSGRVIAWVSSPDESPSVGGVQRRWLVLSPEQLTATINTDLPQEVRWMTLYLLGRVHYAAGRLDQAEAALLQALGAPPADPGSLAVVDYYLGLIESEKAQADLNQVIAYYTETVSLQPDLAAALNNRGAAYLERRASGDLERAEADFRRALFISPEDSAPAFNLALALAKQGRPRLAEALELLEGLERVDPESAGVQNALCWYRSLQGSPEQALPHCDRAVALDDSGNSNDSRGLALALLGRPQEAADEFEIFLERLETADPQAYARYAPTRQAWADALRSGSDPFDQATLDRLLRE